MAPISVTLIALASVVFYVGTYHLLFYIRNRERREILAFSLTCFTITLYDVLCAGLYGAHDVTEGVYWQNNQAITMAIFAVCLIWFVSDFTHQLHKRWTFMLHGYWLTQLIILLICPIDRIWSNQSSIKIVPFFGNSITYHEMLPGPIINIQGWMGLLTCAYLVGMLVRRCRAGSQRETLPVLIGVVAVSIAVIRDTAIMSGLMVSFYSIEFAFMLLVIAMGYSLTTFHAEIRSALHLSRNELKRLAAAIEAADESILITDASGVIQYVNPAFERVTGYSRDESVGKPASLLQSGRHNRTFYDELWQTIRSGNNWHGTFFNRRKDGSIIEEDTTISPIKDVNGHIVNFVAVERDVTQQHMMEGRVRQSQKMAAVGQLAHRIAHDCTNVLVRVMGNAELARVHVPQGSDAARHLDEIVSAAHSMASLTSSLLSFSHPGTPSFKPTRLRNVITGMFAMIKSTMSPSVNVVMDEDPINPKVRIDQSQIEQAVMHIILNSSDSMPDGGTLTIKTAEVGSDHALFPTLAAISKQKGSVIDQAYAALILEDTGVGIDPDTLGKIFEPFFTTKTDRKNAGLGLCTVYSIVESHHGFIVVDSTPGAGTRTTIFLPLST